jgi:predicted short-subunit dehydrogenase-like oxidoreductase (DUF2520 family)
MKLDEFRTLNIIGAGKLGRTLGRLWAQNGIFHVQDVMAAHLNSAAAAVEFIGAGRAMESMDRMRAADIWMLTPPDGSIVECCIALATCARLRAGDVVFHCSGSLPARVMAAAARVGAHVASVHPVKSIADPERATQTFAGTWCGIEGDAAALAVLRPAFEAIGARLFNIDPDAKTIYHAASVIACNYLVALIEAGTRCYEKAGLERGTALQVMEPLVRETLDNIFRMGTADALTGPIARGDHAVVTRQFEALAQWQPEIAAVYSKLGALAVELARERGSARSDDLDEILRKLS